MPSVCTMCMTFARHIYDMCELCWHDSVHHSDGSECKCARHEVWSAETLNRVNANRQRLHYAEAAERETFLKKLARTRKNTLWFHSTQMVQTNSDRVDSVVTEMLPD